MLCGKISATEGAGVASSPSQNARAFLAACALVGPSTMSAFTIVAGVSAASSVRGARREALGGRGVVAAINGGAAKNSRKGRGLALVARASLVKDDGRPVIIIDNYDSFTYNLSQVRIIHASGTPPRRSHRPAHVPSTPSYPNPTSLYPLPDRPIAPSLSSMCTVPRRPRSGPRGVQERREDRG